MSVEKFCLVCQKTVGCVEVEHGDLQCPICGQDLGNIHTVSQKGIVKFCSGCETTVKCVEGFQGILKCPICGETLGDVYDGYAPKKTKTIKYAVEALAPNGQKMQWAAYSNHHHASNAAHIIQSKHPDWQIHIIPEEVESSGTLEGALAAMSETPTFDKLLKAGHCPKCGSGNVYLGIDQAQCLSATCHHTWKLTKDLTEAFLQKVKDSDDIDETMMIMDHTGSMGEFADTDKLAELTTFISQSVSSQAKALAKGVDGKKHSSEFKELVMEKFKAKGKNVVNLTEEALAALGFDKDGIKFDGTTWINHSFGTPIKETLEKNVLENETDSYKLNIPLEWDALKDSPFAKDLKANGYTGCDLDEEMYLLRMSKMVPTKGASLWWNTLNGGWVKNLAEATQWDEEFILAHPVPEHLLGCWVGVSDIYENDGPSPDLTQTASNLVDAVMGIPCDSNASTAEFQPSDVQVANPSRIFFDTYKATALECETDGDDHYLNENYSVEDIGTDLEFQMLDDCMKFFDQEHDRIAEFEGVDDHGYNCWERAGACFWLSRQGHGAGFFNCEIWSQETRDHLQAIAESFGQTYLDFEDGKICA